MLTPARRRSHKTPPLRRVTEVSHSFLAERLRASAYLSERIDRIRSVLSSSIRELADFAWNNMNLRRRYGRHEAIHERLNERRFT